MQKIIKSLAVIAAIFIARLLPFNLIIGSQFSMFSWTSVFAPVIGLQCGLAWVGCFLLTPKLLTVVSLGKFFLHRLPLICSARVFAKADIWMSVGIPVVCMFLFMMHPVGGQAWTYAMYWVIPIGLHALNQSAWSRALQASFVAHAVGSVVWLYTGSISADVWMSLIPIVAVERLAMAGGIVICNELCSRVIQGISKLYYKSFAVKVVQ